MTIEVRDAKSRFHTRLDWLDSWHSFSFADHYDRSNTHFGLLLVNNDDVIRGGGGFGAHSHRDMEIVTWVLSGELEHRDSTGTVGIITPGLAQRMSAGSGITHSEVNANRTADVHLVQMWVLPDTEGIEPGYEQEDVSAALEGGGLVTVASGHGNGAGTGVHIHQRDAELLAGRLRAGVVVDIPDAPHVHAFVADGTGDLDGTGSLGTGDAVRLSDAGAHRFTAGSDGAEILVWVTA
jgi:redox-sensitive bicupin YhaK (pirin superfamily)